MQAGHGCGDGGVHRGAGKRCAAGRGIEQGWGKLGLCGVCTCADDGRGMADGAVGWRSGAEMVCLLEMLRA